MVPLEDTTQSSLCTHYLTHPNTDHATCSQFTDLITQMVLLDAGARLSLGMSFSAHPLSIVLDSNRHCPVENQAALQLALHSPACFQPWNL
mmetsp:Transcript_164490/g.299897  ORF Transcript_164490/g.299897 Transcript_164490/m.299897 type:complete len:91 (-) Transcript_164490:6-278(-)